MGNEQQQQNQNSNFLVPPSKGQQQQIDVVSDILESEHSNILERTQQAIRISQSQRDQLNSMSNISGLQNKKSSQINKQILNQLVKLPRNSEKNVINQQKYIIQGVLTKWEPSKIFSQTTQRYCAATINKFMYNQHNLKQSMRAGIINFDLLSCQIVPDLKFNKIDSFRIKVNGSQKQFVFSSGSHQQNKKWVDILTQITQKSAGKQFNLTYLSHYHRFWRKDYFSQFQFRSKAQTGDLILMRGVTQSAMMQRAITQQQYDHIVMVVKNIKNQILLFQANGATGVGILPWKRFIQKQYYKQQQIVVYRKLKVQRNEKFFEQVEEFVQRNMGRKYKFSVKKYLMNRESSQNQDKKSYFCSSLVAKLYKNLQLLDQKVSSITYMPHSFTQKQNMQLKQNGRYGPAKLGKQHIIVFQKMFFNQNP